MTYYVNVYVDGRLSWRVGPFADRDIAEQHALKIRDSNHGKEVVRDYGVRLVERSSPTDAASDF
jgi:hypothetical protein